MIDLLRRQPLVSFVVIAFAWTWAFVIVFLILFPLPDIIVRNEMGSVVALIALALTIAVATRGKLGYAGREPAPSVALTYSAP